MFKIIHTLVHRFNSVVDSISFVFLWLLVFDSYRCPHKLTTHFLREFGPFFFGKRPNLGKLPGFLAIIRASKSRHKFSMRFRWWCVVKSCTARRELQEGDSTLPGWTQTFRMARSRTSTTRSCKKQSCVQNHHLLGDAKRPGTDTGTWDRHYARGQSYARSHRLRNGEFAHTSFYCINGQQRRRPCNDDCLSPAGKRGVLFLSFLALCSFL